MLSYKVKVFAVRGFVTILPVQLKPFPKYPGLHVQL